MITPKLAQVALSFGADDIDGTVVEETIYHMAGSETDDYLSRAELGASSRKPGMFPSNAIRSTIPRRSRQLATRA